MLNKVSNFLFYSTMFISLFTLKQSIKESVMRVFYPLQRKICLKIVNQIKKMMAKVARSRWESKVLNGHERIFTSLFTLK